MIIVGSLTAPLADGTPGTGIAAGITYDPDNGKMIATDIRYAIVNYDPGLTASDGTFAKIETMDGTTDCYWVGCGPVPGMTGLVADPSAEVP